MGIHMKNNINYTGATSLNTLRDVVIDSPATGQGLVYNEETQTWINGNVASGGGIGASAEVEWGMLYLPEDLTLATPVGQDFPFESYFKKGTVEVDVENHGFILKAGKTYELEAIIRGIGNSSYRYFQFYNHNKQQLQGIVGVCETTGSYADATTPAKCIVKPDEDSLYTLRCTASSSDTQTTTITVTAYFKVTEIKSVIKENFDGPIGSIISYYGRAIPKPYLVCDGSEYNIKDYPILAQHFEDNYGSVNYFGGDGENTFAVPSFESKVKVEEWNGYYIDEKYLYDGVGAIASYNGRTFYKNTEGLSIIVAVHGPGWTGGVILSTNPNMTCYSSYNTSEIISPQASFEYLGLTWYICQDPYSWAAVYSVSGLAPIIDITSSWDDYEVVGKEVLDIVDLSYPEKLSLIKYDLTNNNKVNYSTEEQVIGTWIDGSTLYQKTYSFYTKPSLGAIKIIDDTIKHKTHKIANVQGTWSLGSFEFDNAGQASIFGRAYLEGNTASPPDIYLDSTGLCLKINHDNWGFEVAITVQYVKI